MYVFVYLQIPTAQLETITGCVRRAEMLSLVSAQIKPKQTPHHRIYTQCFESRCSGEEGLQMPELREIASLSRHTPAFTKIFFLKAKLLLLPLLQL